jgi:Tripartite tricarboxylate transporter TctB family
MLSNQRVCKGLALIAVALFFGVQSASYHLGTFARAGTGMFPLMVSVIVGLIGLVMLVQAHFEASAPMTFNFRNTALVMASLIGFVVLAEHLNATAAIVFLVFVSTLAGSDYSVLRNVKISAVLVAIAWGFHHFLGLNLSML